MRHFVGAAGSVGAAGPARAPRTVASDGGSITISSYQSFFLDGELRAAAQAASRMKTVVGMPGTTTPMRPSTRHSTAKA